MSDGFRDFKTKKQNSSSYIVYHYSILLFIVVFQKDMKLEKHMLLLKNIYY